jgi:transcriptional regulator with XRE-family HTH domain
VILDLNKYTRRNIVLGSNVRALREKNNLSQEELAQAIGLRQSMISEIERGNRTPSLPVVGRIAETFGVSLDELVRGVFEPLTPEPTHA